MKFLKKLFNKIFKREKYEKRIEIIKMLFVTFDESASCRISQVMLKDNHTKPRKTSLFSNENNDERIEYMDNGKQGFIISMYLYADSEDRVIDQAELIKGFEEWSNTKPTKESKRFSASELASFVYTKWMENIPIMKSSMMDEYNNLYPASEIY